MTHETWKPIPEYEGKYEVSDLGNVRSVDRQVRTVAKNGTETTRRVPGRVLKPQTGWNPVYLQVNLKPSSRLVHHLVALAFIGPNPEGMEVAHNNGNAHDNRAVNLRYATAASNANDRRTHGTSGRGHLNASAKLTEDEARRIKESNTPAWILADEFGVHPNTISRIRSGARWGHL